MVRRNVFRDTGTWKAMSRNKSEKEEKEVDDEEEYNDFIS